MNNDPPNPTPPDPAPIVPNHPAVPAPQIPAPQAPTPHPAAPAPAIPTPVAPAATSQVTPPAAAPASPFAPATPEPVAPAAAPTIASSPADTPFQKTAETIGQIKSEILKVFVGQPLIVDQLLISLLTGGHLLLEGKPGLGKTHLVLSLAKAIGGTFGRVQFTPDLMPSDVTGHTLYDLAKQEFKVRKGPVFVNLLLADEINRAPAKTQAALLEVMQEEQVTIDGESLKLDPPFLVIATQNPIEQEGTYPLPEAQLDRFLMKVLIDYPSEAEESAIVSAAASQAQGRGLNPNSVNSVCSLEDIISMQHDTASIQSIPEVVDYAVRLVRATRNAAGISLGAGTRGAISLVRAAKAYALFEGRAFIAPHDIKRAVSPVLRHRVGLTPDLLISGESVDEVLESLIRTVEAPRG